MTGCCRIGAKGASESDQPARCPLRWTWLGSPNTQNNIAGKSRCRTLTWARTPSVYPTAPIKHASAWLKRLTALTFRRQQPLLETKARNVSYKTNLRSEGLHMGMRAAEYEECMQHAIMASPCPQMPDSKQGQLVWTAEAGYCSDMGTTRHGETPDFYLLFTPPRVAILQSQRSKKKELQHQHLQEALLACGYEVAAGRLDA